MKRFFKENGLSVVLFVLFALSLAGQIASGRGDYNNERQENHQPPVSVGQYLTTGHFVEALFENWESEFLQMGAYVVLTVFLRQKGSPESKKLDEPEEVDADPKGEKDKPDAPGPVKKGGWQLKIYQNSLSIALFGLFIVSFLLHAWGEPTPTAKNSKLKDRPLSPSRSTCKRRGFGSSRSKTGKVNLSVLRSSWFSRFFCGKKGRRSPNRSPPRHSQTGGD